jgi:hypothetical protein
MRCGLWLAALAFTGAASAGPVAYDYTRFELPDGWVRNDEQRYASFSPAGGGVTVSIFTRFGDDDAEGTLEDFVERSETGEESLSRSEAEDISNDDFDVYRQETRARDKEGRIIRRFYLAADKDDRGTVIAIEGDEANYVRVEKEARAIVTSLTLVDDEPATVRDLEEKAGEGGLDGFYVSGGARGFFDVATMGWAYGERPEALTFDPLGGVYRGPPARFDIDIYNSCTGETAWRCGRYRIEGSVLALRWADGTIERLPFAQDGDAIRLGDRVYRPAPGGGASPSGAFAFTDAFNTGDWPQKDEDGNAIAYSIRFLDDGQFQLQGVSAFRTPRVAAGQAATGRFKIDGHSVTLVYTNGASEVLGFARFPAEGGERLLIGGKVFAAP